MRGLNPILMPEEDGPLPASDGDVAVVAEDEATARSDPSCAAATPVCVCVCNVACVYAKTGVRQTQREKDRGKTGGRLR